jgi:putative two-component system response regulator
LDSALAQPPSLILLDVCMPEMDGFEFCRRLKKNPATRQVPIVFISYLDNAEVRVKGFSEGAVDFISKPFLEQEVLARVKTHVNLYMMQ